MNHGETSDCFFPVREHEAAAYVEAIADPVLANFLNLCVARARMRSMQWSGLSDEQWKANLPIAPFDRLYFVGVMSEVFSRPDLVKAMLDGKSIAEATGWDV